MKGDTVGVSGGTKESSLVIDGDIRIPNGIDD
jgi:hypothetical protein